MSYRCKKCNCYYKKYSFLWFHNYKYHNNKNIKSFFESKIMFYTNEHDERIKEYNIVIKELNDQIEYLKLLKNNENNENTNYLIINIHNMINKIQKQIYKYETALNILIL